MTLAEFQGRVEGVILALEFLHQRQYPLRAIPMDIVTDAIIAEASSREGGDRAPLEVAEDLSPNQLGDLLNVILSRNMSTPKNAWAFSDGPTTYDISAPWLVGGFLPHNGVERLREGG